MRPHRLPLTAALLPLALVALGACGDAERPHLGAPEPAATTAPAPTTLASHDDDVTTTTATAVDLDATGIVARAVVGVPIELFDAPGGAHRTTVAPTTEFGSPTVLAARRWSDADRDWLEVQLPVRPNGTTAWVRADTVDLGRTALRIEVDLAARRLVVRDGDAIVIDTTVAVGAAATPTPAGTYFVTDLIDNPDDAGAYGPFALGLSAHSDVLDQFGGGDGQIGIHGTDAPGSIGQAVSHGCVRVPNEVVTRLAGLVPLGTPVTIR